MGEFLEMNSRDRWAEKRLQKESAIGQNRIYCKKLWNRFPLIKIATYILKGVGIYRKGVNNAANIKIHEIEHRFDKLPSNFDGLTILHFSDLHLNERPELIDLLYKLIKDLKSDLWIFTGDFVTSTQPDFFSDVQKKFIEKMGEILKDQGPRFGMVGVLGNHDSCQSLACLEKIGIKMLVNENFEIELDGEKIQIIGMDDVHLFNNQEEFSILDMAQSSFTICLVHSPELFDKAQEKGVDLYLCGHTHGGQICLPFGERRPIIANLQKGGRFFKGSWSYKNMKGHTSSGVGTTAIPVRYNSQAEIVIHRLSN